MLRHPRMFLKAVDKLPQTSGLMTRKRNLEIALALETNFPLKTPKLEKATAQERTTPKDKRNTAIAQERATRKTTAHERQIYMAKTHWRLTSSTSYNSSSQ